MATTAKRLRVVGAPDLSNRAPPPSYLSKDEASEWLAIVGTMPANWFPRETHPALAALCRHTCRPKLLGEAIAKRQQRLLENADGVAVLDKLLAMAERESRAITALMRSMRLTQQARLDKETAGAAAAKHRPSYYDQMEDDGDE